MFSQNYFMLQYISEIKWSTSLPKNGLTEGIIFYTLKASYFMMACFTGIYRVKSYVT